MKTLFPIALAAALAACGGPTPLTNAADNADTASNETLVDEADANMPDAAANEAANDGANDEAVASNETAPVEAKADAAYLGRWIGVEGMFLNVTKRDGGVKLEMQWDLDHKGSFDGTITAEGIAFTRDGKDLVLKPTDGDATGLKYLAGKKDCLTVASGEGYCRK